MRNTTMTWKKLLEDLKYKDWICETPGIWWCPSFYPEIFIQKVGNFVKVHNGGFGEQQSDKQGYLDETLVLPQHVKIVLEMIYEVKSLTNQGETK